MRSLILKTLSIIPQSYRKKLLVLQLMMLLAAVLEFLSVLSIGPFISLAVKPEYVHENYYLANIYGKLAFSSEKQFIIFIGLLFGLLFGVANAFVLNVQVILVRISSRLESEFSSKLFSFYLLNNAEFNKNTSSSTLISKINNDVKRVCNGVILSLLQINARILSILVLIGLLLVVSGRVAVLLGGVLGITYLGIFYFTNKRMKENGKLRSVVDQEKARLLYDGIEGKKYVNLFGLENDYLQKLVNAYRKQVDVSISNKLLQDLPYFTIESLAFFIVVLVVGFSLSSSSEIGVALAELGVICLAGYRLIPKFQQVYRAATTIKTNHAALLRIYNDLTLSMVESGKIEINGDVFSGDESKSLILQNVSFRYKTGALIISAINLEVKPGEVIGIVGPSGIGKSTLLQIMMGTLIPNEGRVLYSGVPIYKINKDLWRSVIGFVDSATFIFDGSVLENILLNRELDEEWLKKVLEVSCLDDVIEDLENGLETYLGSKGVRLSSGQLQRLGFARAIYRKPQILFLDEATNALDHLTQQEVLGKMKKVFTEMSFVIVSHRPDMLDNYTRLIALAKP